MDVPIDLLIKDVIGPVTTGFASLIIFAEMPSKPVAFLYSICLSVYHKYFYERCAGGPKSSDFWPTIKPFLSGKGVKTNNPITLSENNEIVNDPQKVSKWMFLLIY
jgi:hypothetical protein